MSDLSSNKVSMFDGASPKLTFILGLVTGVAVVSLVGWALTSTTGISFDSAKNSGDKVVTDGKDTTPPVDSTTVTLKDNDYIRGSADAPVTLIEYSDFECPFCQRFHTSVLRIMQEYAGQVNWVYRHYPLGFHANAQKEAEAAECVGKLGGADKFWEFTDKIYERTTANGTGFALTALAPLAKEIGVSESEFTQCLDSGEFTAKVQNDLLEGSNYGVGGTPTTFINGRVVEGAVPYEQLKAVVDQALSEL
ncbi:MAG: DsbA family protein [Patescibacteria group bacterium]